MALSGVHIVFGGWEGTGVAGHDSATLLINPVFSQIMATSAVSKANPAATKTILSINASAAIIYITGKNLTPAMLTDGVTPSRYYDPTLGGGRDDVFVNGGDQFAWMFA